MGNANTLQPTSTVLWQAQYDLSRSELMLSDENGEQFTYYTHGIHARKVYPHENWRSFYLGAGTHFSHADHGALGSFRALANLEGGVRLFIPLPVLRMFTLEAGVAAGLGWSELNFGGGDIPQGGLDARMGGMAMLSFEREGYRLGLQVFKGGSPVRDYWEQGLGVAFSVPLGSIVEAPPPPCPPKDECMEGLAGLEKKVGNALASYNAVVGEGNTLNAEVENLKKRNAQLRQQQWTRKISQESKGYSCPKISPEEHPQLVPWPKQLPVLPVFDNCASYTAKLKQYLEDIRAWVKTAATTTLASLKTSLQKLKEEDEALEAWNSLECKLPPGAEKLTAEIRFNNDDPDLRLSTQKDVGEPKGFAEPVLDEWIRFLRQNNSRNILYKILIDGYASEIYKKGVAHQSEDDMINLAQARARHAYEYLTRRGSNGGFYCYGGDYKNEDKRKVKIGQCSKDEKKINIGGPFVAMPALGPIESQWVESYGGHGSDDLMMLAGNAVETSDPRYRMVRITLLKRKTDVKGKDTWIEVDLAKTGAADVLR
ncbi:MAG: hypothetical protein HY877_07455 [Deltaproteobacteria bacterium]|nr:hypothetical protein [Deltaproteobacteria bacterium]